MIEEKIQRNIFEVINLHEADDRDYWRDQSSIKRIETIEFMRKVMFGHDRVSKRLQRVLTITKLKENLINKINFISKQDLLINKQASGRPQDLVDFDKLQNE